MGAPFNLVDELRSISSALRTAELQHALCGGLAVALYGYARATKDVDLLVMQTDVEAALAVLAHIGFTLRAGPIVFAAGTAEERLLYRATKVAGTDHLTVDLMIVTPVLEPAWRDRREVDWAGQRLSVVSREGLAKMKRLAGRRQDLLDLEKLGLEVDDGD